MSESLISEDRIHALDAVRAFALIAGIVLHATMAFLPMSGDYNWPISDPSSSLTLAVVFFVVHIFRMTVFFLIAGFFARLLLERSGTAGFLKNRWRRVALPLVAAWLVLMPLLLMTFLWAMAQAGMKGMPEFPAPSPQQGLPWGHLWFLYVLLVLYAIVLTGRAVIIRLDHRRVLQKLLDAALATSLIRRYAPFALAVPLCLSLYTTEWWVQWQGIPTPHAGFIPNTPALIAYGTAFLLGWFLHRQKGLLQVLRQDWLFYLMAAIVLSLSCLGLIGLQPQLDVVALSSTERLMYAASYTTASWCWSLALVGAALRYLSAPDDRTRYIADASYWMYLLHLPLITALQVWMLKWSMHWTLKFSLILSITMALLLFTYHFGVRATFLGAFLNGRRHARVSPGTSAAEA